MGPDQSPFQLAWMSFNLGDVRECDGTYCFYAYESLPQLDTSLFRGDFKWLMPKDQRVEAMTEIHQPSDDHQQKMLANLEAIKSQAQSIGLQLPAEFVAFMNSLELQHEIPSCTACYFDLPEKIIKNPLEDGYFIRFMNDQQDVLLWYLYLRPNGNHCITVSNVYIDEVDFSQMNLEAFKGAVAFCAPAFEEFVYRFWLENKIWFALDEGRLLSDEEQRYLDQIRNLL
jgi:hypothetical protein